MNQDEIKEKRDKIKEELIRESRSIQQGAFITLSGADVREAFWKYDKVFLGGYFQRTYPGELAFSISSRMTRAAGKTLWRKNAPENQQKIEIRMSVDFVFAHDMLGRKKRVNGIETRDNIDAFLLVLEHEICHALEVAMYGSSSCAAERFRGMAFSLFGHTEAFHELPTNGEIVRSVMGIEPGDTVGFSYQGEEKIGKVASIKKRAAVMVQDEEGMYQDRHGRRYTKYYVPIYEMKKKF